MGRTCGCECDGGGPVGQLLSIVATPPGLGQMRSLPGPPGPPWWWPKGPPGWAKPMS